MLEQDILLEKIRLARLKIIEKMDVKTAKEHKHIIEFKNNGTYFEPIKEAQVFTKNGKKFAKIWLLNAQYENGNGWGVSKLTLDANINKFRGRPYVVTAQSFLGKPSMYGEQMVHPSIPTNDINKYLEHQEYFRVGTIVDVIKEGPDYYAQIEILPKYENHSLPPFCSPAIYQANFNEPENDIKTWEAMHLAGLNKDPAYGARLAILKGTCIGTKESCAIQFKQGKLKAELICSMKQRLIKKAQLDDVMEFNQVKKQLVKIAQEFDESKHPRDESGKFSKGGKNGGDGRHNKKSENGGINKGFSASQMRSIKSAVPDSKISNVSKEMAPEGGKLITFEDGSEYLHFTNHEDAERAAKESMENLYDDIGIEGWNPDFAQQFIKVDSVTARQIAIDEGESLRDSLSDEGLDESEIQSQVDERVDYVESKINEDARKYFVEEEGLYNDEEFAKQSFVTVDTDAMFEESINMDGVGHTLAGYDGEEIELDDGSFMYRTN